jgi:hypothetical protein
MNISYLIGEEIYFGERLDFRNYFKKLSFYGKLKYN